MTRPITFLMCTYNGAQFLEKTIPAVLAQEEYSSLVEEFIIVDNASNDNSKSIIDLYIGQVDNIVYIYEERQGVTYARQHMTKANSKWVVWVDDDNLLDKEYLKRCYAYIQGNENIGALNGSNIAYPEDDLSTEQSEILETVLPNLACSHKSIDDLLKGKKSRLNSPVGAGLFILVEPLKEMLDAGWTKNEGRKGDELGSGEDGEIVRFVLNKGYEYGICKEAILYHIIPSSRLEDKYVFKLIKGLAVGSQKYMEQDPSYKSSVRLIRLLLSVGVYPLRLIITQNKSSKKRLKYSNYANKYIIKIMIRRIYKKGFD